MNRLADIAASLAQSLCSGASALALPPPNFAIVPLAWKAPPGQQGFAHPPEVEISLWADTTRALTAATLYGAIPRPFAPAAETVTGTAAVAGSLDLSTKTTHCDTVIQAALPGAAPTVPGDGLTIAFVQSAGAPAAGALTNVGKAYTFTFKGGVTTVANFETAIAASADLAVKTPGTGANILAVTVDEFTATALAGAADAFLSHTTHGLLTGDGPFQLTTSGALPAGLALLTDYWVVKTGANTFSVATSLANALAGIVVEFTTNGTPTTTWTADATCARIHWHSATLLGLAGDGVISLDAQAAYWDTRKHSPQFIAYAVTATFGSGSGVVSGEVRPRVNA